MSMNTFTPRRPLSRRRSHYTSKLPKIVYFETWGVSFLAPRALLAIALIEQSSRVHVRSNHSGVGISILLTLLSLLRGKRSLPIVI
jgi:hypothetical protein